MKIKWYNKIGMLEIILLAMVSLAAYKLYVVLHEMEAPTPTVVGDVTVPTFEQTVELWSDELAESIVPVEVADGVKGNCLPVAMELQRRIVATGRIAFIAVVHPEELETGHAVVVYSNEVAGRLDSVIDNGYSTQNKVKPKDFLDTGVFGKYFGTCKDPNPTEGTCGNIGLAW